MDHVRYSPLSLEKLCINRILEEVWNDNFENINGLEFFFYELDWREKFKERHEIIKWCKKKK